jgi:endonuclease YncB( thermonuclease family)
MLNELLVRKGLAVIFTYPPNVRHVDHFVEAQLEARRYLEGFWSRGGLGMSPYEYRRKRLVMN